MQSHCSDCNAAMCRPLTIHIVTLGSHKRRHKPKLRSSRDRTISVPSDCSETCTKNTELFQTRYITLRMLTAAVVLAQNCFSTPSEPKPIGYLQYMRYCSLLSTCHGGILRDGFCGCELSPLSIKYNCSWQPASARPRNLLFFVSVCGTIL